MSEIREVIKQSSFYFISQVFILIGSFISFPIFTRVLSKQEYGLMSLITATLFVLTLLFSGNLKDAILRFYGEYRCKDTEGILIANSLTGSFLMSLTGFLVAFLVAFQLLDLGLSKQTFKIISLALLLIIIRNINSLIMNLYRVEEKIINYNLISILNKYFGLACSILLIIYFSMGLYGLYKGLVIGEGLIAFYLAITMIKKYGKILFALSQPVLITFLKYSFPLAIGGMSAYLLNFGDRYLICYFLGKESVATYTVAYTIPDYIQTSIIISFNMSLYPKIMNLWGENKGEIAEATSNDFFVLYFVLAVPIVLGLTAVRYEIIEIFASKKYVQSSALVPILAAGILIRGFFFPLAAGLYRAKKTWVLSIINIFGAIFNTILNLLLIPIFNLQGAALATLISYIFILIFSALVSAKYQKITIPYKKLLKYTIISIIMYLAINNLRLDAANTILILLYKVGLGVTIYSIGLFIIEKNVRNTIVRFCNNKIVTNN